MGALCTGLQRTTYKFNFSEILTKNLPSAFIENTPKDEKSIEKKHTSVNDQQHEKFVRSSLPTLDRFD
jgi:hypothetical protein